MSGHWFIIQRIFILIQEKEPTKERLSYYLIPMNFRKLSYQNFVLQYSKVPNNRAPPAYYFWENFSDPPAVIRTPRLLIFDY